MPPDPTQSALAAFDYSPRTKLIFGAGAIARIGELAKELPATKVLLVTDPGIVSAGHAARVTQLLETAGLKVACFDAVEENPGTHFVEKFFVRVDVTEEFPFLVTKLSPYYDR